MRGGVLEPYSWEVVDEHGRAALQSDPRIRTTAARMDAVVHTGAQLSFTGDEDIWRPANGGAFYRMSAADIPVRIPDTSKCLFFSQQLALVPSSINP